MALVFLAEQHVRSIVFEVARGLYGRKDDPPLRYEPLQLDRLEAALALPQQPYYADIVQKAAILGYAVIEGHPFKDGNKRIGMSTMLVFLLVNGWSLNVPKGAVLHTALQVVNKKMTKQEFIAWVRSHAHAAKRRFVRLGRRAVQ